MTWQWVAVLGIVVFAWTVLRVTTAWQNVTMYKNVPEAVKNAIAEQTGFKLNED